MSGFEVEQPILCSPFEEPQEHWQIVEGEPPRRAAGRRAAIYYYRPPGPVNESDGDGNAGMAIELKLVTLVRRRLAEWREAGRPGVTRVTLERLPLAVLRMGHRAARRGDQARHVRGRGAGGAALRAKSRPWIHRRG